MTNCNQMCKFLYILIFLGIASQTTALRCYLCNSFDDKDCASSSLEKFQTACDTGAVGCRKLETTFRPALRPKDEQRRIVRQCAMTTGGSDCTTLYGSNGKRFKSTYCECSSELCNTGTSFRAKLLILITMLAVCSVFLL
ncbi:uncharacterized protein LOC131940842 [Physella acuta]|uniref:uncharacterized protein LOC131940842 n=1 Tax=Physella acuta TaxID=109671 RepID=UPI0027DC174D|nr:uncharacterized protein LOC131940842 [Physella acuta]